MLFSCSVSITIRVGARIAFSAWLVSGSARIYTTFRCRYHSVVFFLRISKGNVTMTVETSTDGATTRLV